GRLRRPVGAVVVAVAGVVAGAVPVLLAGAGMLRGGRRDARARGTGCRDQAEGKRLGQRARARVRRTGGVRGAGRVGGAVGPAPAPARALAAASGEVVQEQRGGVLVRVGGGAGG